MLHGLYSSAQGARLESQRLQVVANNIANANTNAFKRDLPIGNALPLFDDLMNQMEPTETGLQNHHGLTALQEVYTDFSDGPLEATGQPLDVAVRGPGFLRVADKKDNLFLTRDGSLTISEAGELVTTDQGLNVLDPQGLPIEIPATASQLSIGSGGIISDLKLGPIAQIGVVVPVDPGDGRQLKKLGNSLYEMPEETVEAPPEQTRLLGGYVETSSVKPTREMTQMVEITRAFELNMTMVQTQDSSLSNLLDAAARV